MYWRIGYYLLQVFTKKYQDTSPSSCPYNANGDYDWQLTNIYGLIRPAYCWYLYRIQQTIYASSLKDLEII